MTKILDIMLILSLFPDRAALAAARHATLRRAGALALRALHRAAVAALLATTTSAALRGLVVLPPAR